MDISTLNGDDILDIFPSSNASRAGMGFLNQSTCIGGRTSFISIAQMLWYDTLGGENTFSGKKTEQ